MHHTTTAPRPHIPLPQPFTMNRGTAKKLVAMLRDFAWEHEPAQLGFDGFRNVEGVLCELIRSPKSIAWDGVSILYDGAQFFLPDSARKSAKMKGKLPEFPSFETAAWTIEAVMGSRAEQK